MLFNYDIIKDELSQLELEIQKLIPTEPKEVYGMLLPYIKLGGKRIRPSLSFLTCHAFDGDVNKVIKPAAIAELFHNFTLVHDDIEDNSLLRRGEPTLHIKYGIPVALNSGDALYTVLWQAIVSLSLPERELKELQTMYASTFRKVVEGQGIELNWYREKKFDISETNYFDMIGGKTSSLIGFSCQLGAFFAKQPSKIQNTMKKFGENIGLAFQIQDDILNLKGDINKYKKEIGGDITEGKRTLIIIDAFKKVDKKDKEFILSCLLKNESDQDKIQKCIDILDRCHSIDYARNVSSDLIESSKKLLTSLPDSKYKDELLDLSDFVISRDA